jgi:HlyD family secretion protein
VQQAEAAVQDAQRTLDILKNPSHADLVQAQAAVTQAQASLAKLTQGGTSADIAQANASVIQAQASLDKLTAPPTAADLATAQANVAQANVQLAVAKRNLDQARLVAPFDADVAAVSVVPGATAGSASSSAAVSLVDRSVLRVDMNLSETDAARAQVGQPVELTFDALPDVVLQGKIATISPAATVTQNVVTYPAQVEFDPGQAPIKVGMSATATITIQQIANAVLVPSRAIQTQGGVSTVQVVTGENGISVPVQVETGATANGQTEILSCVETGTQCLRPGDRLAIVTTTTRTTQTNGSFGGGVRPVGPFGPGR